MAKLDPLLVQVQKSVEHSVRPQDEKAYHQIMAAGKKLMFSEKTYPLMQEYMQTIKSLADVPEKISHGIVKAMSILFNQSQGSMSLTAMGPAAIMLMVDALQYVEEVLGVDVDKPTIDQTTLLTKDGLVMFLKQASKISDADWQKLGQSPEGAPQGVPSDAPAEAPAPETPTPEPATSLMQG